RLYFMFNPETIVRDYVSYLDQAALDPFNTVYGSNNLVAPPSFMNFRFDLFFDRQDEVASNMDNPGVFADYQFFDLVVRNVIPTDPNSMSTTIPDNGVMMVNPRDITVVFSPQLTVQGRPVNAQVIFEKFSHRMTPIRMRISLEMRVVYIGPMRPMSEYTMETYAAATTNTVTNDDSLDASFTYTELVIADGAANGATGYQPGVNLTVGSGLGSLLGLSDSPNMNVRIAALQWAREHVRPGYTEYNNSTTLRARGVDPSGAFKYVDCSALVWYAYNAIGMTSKMRWGGSTSSPSNTSNMIDAFSRGGIQTLIRWTPADKAQVSLFFKEPSNRSKIQAGDLLLRNKSVVTSKDTGHVAFILGWTPGGDLVVFDAAGPTADPPVGERVISRAKLVDNYSDIVR
ncbi:MAG: hypothetical protein EBR40_11915, partial [Proteobacteria bacterium]|nr:hypothetical protein [Pseudomonadota bacterium]